MGGIACGDDGCRRLSQEEAERIWQAAQEAKDERAADMPTVDDALSEMHRAFVRLTELGFRRMGSAPKDGTWVEIVEPGTTGIFPAQMDDKGRWWVEAHGDLWPGRPALWRPMEGAP